MKRVCHTGAFAIQVMREKKRSRRWCVELWVIGAPPKTQGDGCGRKGGEGVGPLIKGSEGPFS